MDINHNGEMTPSREKVMMTHEQHRDEEDKAIEREREAFERRHAALAAVSHQFLPRGSGCPSVKSMDELEIVEAEWRAANAEMDRISNEIRTGKRQ